MKKLVQFLLIAATLSLAGGCSYHMGSIMHPQVKTIGIAPVVNETTSYNVSAQVRGLLSEAFMVDGSLKVVDQSTADCIIYARATNVTYSESGWAVAQENRDFNIPNQWTVKVTIEYTVIIPGRAEPLLSKRSTSASADFETGPDMETGRTYGLRQAVYRACKNVVVGVTEGW